MSLRLAPVLDEVAIAAIAKNRGFQERNNVERFVMDFEIQSHISDALDCTVRGGMCMPFYTGAEASRMSVDIDLLTPVTVGEAEDIMESITLPPRMQLRKYRPRNPHPLKNLLTYNAYFDSCFGGRKHVKIDIFSEVGVELDAKVIKAGSTVVDFKLPRDMRVLSRGWLLGDKMTALALNTVGVRRGIGTAKQSYDMGTLLRGATKKDMVDAFEAFDVLTGLKAAKFDDGRYSAKHIAADIASSVPSLIDLKHAVALVRDQEKHYNEFNSTYISKVSNYRKTRHITNILMVCALAEAVRDHAGGKTGRKEAAVGVYDAVKEAVEAEGGPKGSRSIKPGRHSKILKNALPEHVVLLEKASALF